MNLETFQSEVNEWQKKVFPKSTFASKLKHLHEELEEISKKPQDAHEYADAILLILGMASLNGVNVSSALLEKFEINKQRKWGEPDEFGVVKHIE